MLCEYGVTENIHKIVIGKPGIRQPSALRLPRHLANYSYNDNLNQITLISSKVTYNQPLVPQNNSKNSVIGSHVRG